MNLIKMLFSFVLIVVYLSSCKDEVTPPLIDPNEPLANAGEDQVINVGSYFLT